MLLLILQASSLGIVDSRGRGGTRGGRGRGRGGGAFKHTEQAPPPTALTILGFKPEEKDAVVAHFKVGIRVVISAVFTSHSV